MLRIHFTAEDIARTRLSTVADPLWEVLLSHFRLGDPAPPAHLRPWTARLRARPDLTDLMRPGAALLAALAPRGRYVPDFLTPAESAAGLDAGLDAVRATDPRRLRRELDTAARRLPAGLPELARALGDFHRAAVGAHDDLVRASVEADVATRTGTLLAGGVEALLRGFAPMMRWRRPVLEVRHPADRDLHLGGRGLRFVPSFFCDGTPVSLADPDLSPVVVYPIAAEHRAAGTGTDGSLAELMGPTRAAVLAALRHSSSTTQLATRLHASLASMSRHTKTLRQAGLITSTRRGPAVLHGLTPLGRRLLDGG
ncbi:helix-turn-helix domain-containing protein [Herbidospora sp. NEAU-GS84]|uniref:Helix-turn-helix domain-containing protein n=1 Tax=Herbidospora solisilvae TaxID=2696284 RepID=A0A7C9MYE5_9ACTN|nr:winged helix-turn-helix domain-containing protein [Herbidospora solisilvae]NAS20369.1 helix-turn-helix domain-containing protein [Herbidospora solisilvae]